MTAVHFRQPSVFVRTGAALLLAAMAFATPGAVRGQALEASVRLEQPTQSVAYDFSTLRSGDRASILLVKPTDWPDKSEADRSADRDAIYSWELFLLGLHVPYELIESDRLDKGIKGDTRLVIAPLSEGLSSTTRRNLLRFVDRGGALVASGRVGAYDERGRSARGTFFSDMFGADLVGGLSEQPFGLQHTISARTVAGAGVDPDYHITLGARSPFVAARTLRATALGHPLSYSGKDDASLRDLTLMLVSERGRGRVFWRRFAPQDISRDAEQQRMAQRVMVNVLAWLLKAPGVSVDPWPDGRPSAFSVAALPSIGFDPLAYVSGWNELLAQLRRTGQPATFFPTTGEVLAFPDLLVAMSEAGEIGIAGDSDDILVGAPVDEQARRLGLARRSIGASGGLGVYPPGGLHDGRTIRAAVEEGFGYLLVPGPSRMAPTQVRWWEDVDYRALSDDELSIVTGSVVAAGEKAEPDPAWIVPIEPGLADFAAGFLSAHAAGGLYVLPFHPELHRAGSGRARQLDEAIAEAARNRAWSASLTDIVQWWALRTGLSVRIVRSDDDEVVVAIVNPNDRPVDLVSITAHIGSARFDGLEISGATARIETADRAGDVRAVIERLEPGTAMLTFKIDR